MRRWARRAAALHGELREVADLGVDPRWWLVAGGAALAWERRKTYVISDAEPIADTFIGFVATAPRDPIADAIARAHAARAAIRALDGQLPDQPLAVTIRRSPLGAVAEPSALEVAAFAIGDRCWCARLAASPAEERELADDLAAVLAGHPPRILQPLGVLATPFVTVSIGDEPLETARHGHRRGWIGNGEGAGPWLGLSRAGGLALVSTCHMIVDGFGHAWLSSEIRTGTVSTWTTSDTIASTNRVVALPKLSKLKPSPIGVAWRELAEPPKALRLAYALGQVLHAVAGHADARFSPTFQIPVAPGAAADPMRRRRRVVPAIASVRFDGGVAEPFERFAARTREMLARETAGSGLSAHLLAAAQGAPAPLAWKRRAVGPGRPRWLESVANLIGGRGCVSKIRVDVPGIAVPPLCAVSSPARVASAEDPVGGCVVTVVGDGARASITLCGSGFAGTHADAEVLLDQVLGRAY